MKAGRWIARRRLIVSGMVSVGAALAVASVSLACTVPVGMTWYSDGSTSKSGPAGTTVTAYGTQAKAASQFRLVTGNSDGPPGHDDHGCMFNITNINPNIRVSSSSGFIGMTTGAVTASPGVWQVCFRETNGSTSTIPVSFTVV